MIPQLSPVPAIPKPFGPHKVGTTEWEVPISEIPSLSPLPEAKINTIKFRLFYPTTPKAKSRTSASWLPSPQREWNQAYATFLGAGPRMSSVISLIPTLLNMTNMPCTADAPLLVKEGSSPYPLVVFSHGLGGNFNAYSAVCTALASFGIVCAAPEHRDGSAPMSIIRAADGRKATTIPYQRHPHAPTAKVLNARNGQLRIRLWELEQLFTVLTGLNEGKTFSNYAVAGTKVKSGPSLKNVLDLRPGHVTWAGHSFGACTTVQFVKSVYYHQFLPSLKNTEFENDLDWRPLLKVTDNSDLVRQVTPESPLILLDLWAMPLRAGLTRWLWEKPLPCYDRKLPDKGPAPPTNVVAIISAEFYKWPELLNRMKAALSARPAEAMYTLEKRTSADSTNYKPLKKSNSQLISTPGKKSTPGAEEPVDIVPRQGFEENRDQDQESDAGDEIFVTPFATPADEFPFEEIMMKRRSGFEAWRASTECETSIAASTEAERSMETDSMREAVRQIKQMQLDLEMEKEGQEAFNEEYMREAIEQPLPESDDEEDNALEEAPLREQVDANETAAVFDPNSVPTSRSSTSSNITTSIIEAASDSTSSLSTLASSIELSRTPSPALSTSTCESASSNSTKASSLSSPIEPLSKVSSTPTLSLALTTTPQQEPPFTPTFSTFTLPPLDLPKTLITPTSNTPSPLDPHLYFIPNTAHLSQSDFGVLFPNLIRYFMAAENPIETIRLNVRAMLAVMRGSGLEIEAYRAEERKGEEVEEDDVDRILTDRCREQRWLRLDLY